jgi:hypothetical protein
MTKQTSDAFGSRDGYAVVGAATRQAITRAVNASLTHGELRTLLAVIDLTSSWSRLGDRVYVADVAARARMTPRHVRDCLTALATTGIITWAPRRGHSVRSYLALPAEGETGSHVPVSPGAVTDNKEEPPFPFDERNRNGGAQETGTAAPTNRNCSSSYDRGDTPRRHPEESSSTLAKNASVLAATDQDRSAATGNLYLDECAVCGHTTKHVIGSDACTECGTMP